MPPLLPLLLALLPAPAHAKRPDDASLEAFYRSLYTAHFDRMDMDVPTDEGALVLFVADEAGAHLSLRGADGAASMRARFAAWKADGWRLLTTFRDVACDAGRDLGVCTANVHQQAWQGDVDQGAIGVRSTLVARWTKAGWTLVHLHESPDAGS